MEFPLIIITSLFAYKSMEFPYLSVKAALRSRNSGRSANLAAAKINEETASRQSSGHSLHISKSYITLSKLTNHSLNLINDNSSPISFDLFLRFQLHVNFHLIMLRSYDSYPISFRNLNPNIDIIL